MIDGEPINTVRKLTERTNHNPMTATLTSFNVSAVN